MLESMEIISNLVLLSASKIDARDLLVQAGFSAEEADERALATGFDKLSRFTETTVERVIRENGRVLRQSISSFHPSISLVLVISQTNVRKIPNGASLLQAELGLSDEVQCFEIIDGCNGFVKAVYLAERMLEIGEVAVIFAGDLHSSMLNGAPVGTSALFGDGFALTAVRKTESFSGTIRQRGSAGDSIRFGGEDNFLRMNGLAVYSFTSTVIPELLGAFDGHGFSDKRFPVFHQASKLIVDHLANKVCSERLPYPAFNLGQVGNLGAGSIPAWMAVQGTINEGTELICTGFGAGLSWGYVTVSWSAGLNTVVEL